MGSHSVKTFPQPRASVSIPRSQKKNRGDLGLTTWILTVEPRLCLFRMYFCASKPPFPKSLDLTPRIEAEVIYDQILIKSIPAN
jgi:hypothetical protein